MTYLVLADLVVTAHLVYAGFVLFGFLAILVCAFGGWAWTTNLIFRTVHLICTTFVALEALWGVTCPLTNLENALLRAAGQSGYQRSFIGHWANKALYYDVPEWVFSAIYITLGAATLLAFLSSMLHRRRTRPQHSLAH